MITVAMADWDPELDDWILSSWRELWHQAVAIDAMCVRRGQAGFVNDHRLDGHRDIVLQVSIENGHHPPRVEITK